VLAPDGTGLRGLRVRFAVDGKASAAATPCGPGCYASRASDAAGAKRVSIDLAGGGRGRSAVSFALPARWPVSALPLLRRAERAFRTLHSVTYREHLSSGAGVPIDTLWRSEAPDRLSYRTTSGNAGVVIGRQRWDLVEAPDHPARRRGAQRVREPTRDPLLDGHRLGAQQLELELGPQPGQLGLQAPALALQPCTLVREAFAAAAGRLARGRPSGPSHVVRTRRMSGKGASTASAPLIATRTSGSLDAGSVGAPSPRAAPCRATFSAASMCLRARK